jgi:hypothetical protein
LRDATSPSAAATIESNLQAQICNSSTVALPSGRVTDRPCHQLAVRIRGRFAYPGNTLVNGGVGIKLRPPERAGDALPASGWGSRRVGPGDDP